MIFEKDNCVILCCCVVVVVVRLFMEMFARVQIPLNVCSRSVSLILFLSVVFFCPESSRVIATAAKGEFVWRGKYAVVHDVSSFQLDSVRNDGSPCR